jgi:hypothetical protein
MDTELSHGRLQELLDYDPNTGVFTWRVARGNAKAGSIAGHRGGRGYWSISINGRPYRAHRLAWLWIYGLWPSGILDHKNRIKDDNRISNIRECSETENLRNRGRFTNNQSGTTGVYRATDNTWCARITVNYKNIHLGVFRAIDDAIAARKAAEARYFGPFSPAYLQSEFL